MLSIFTFQYVSINTVKHNYRKESDSTLHSNMFLLIREGRLNRNVFCIFTFQYVSINTKTWVMVAAR